VIVSTISIYIHDQALLSKPNLVFNIRVQFFKNVPKHCNNVTFFTYIYLIIFYYVNTHLWMIMIKFKTVVVYNMIFMKYLTFFDS